MIFPWRSQKRLGTTRLQITWVTSIFGGICHEKHENGSVPWCYKEPKLSAFFMVFPMNIIKTARYHDATTTTRHLIFVASLSDANHQNSSEQHGPLSLRFPWNSSNRLSTTMLEIARVISFFLFLRYFPWKSPKRLSTRMLQMTDFICNFHDSSH